MHIAIIELTNGIDFKKMTPKSKVKGNTIQAVLVVRMKSNKNLLLTQLSM